MSESTKPIAGEVGYRSAVVEVTSRSGSESSWEITVARIPAYTHTTRAPLAQDVPTDIRAALRAWLDAADDDQPGAVSA